MHSIAATEAKNSFGSLLNQVQRQPIAIAKQGKGVAVLLSMEDYQAMQQKLSERKATSFSWLEDWRESASRETNQDPSAKESYYKHLEEKYR